MLPLPNNRFIYDFFSDHPVQHSPAGGQAHCEWTKVCGLRKSEDADLLCGNPRCCLCPIIDLFTISFRITLCNIVPPVAKLIASGPRSADYASLKTLICSAAILDAASAEACKAVTGVKDFRQCYGMSEILIALISPQNMTGKEGSVGQLVPGAEAKIVDPNTGRTLAANKVGEFCVRGISIAPSYYFNEESTRELFDSEGFVKTGDLVYYDDDDYVYVVDRIKDILKFKGSQISPSELETLLRDHPDVEDAGVVGRPDPDAGDLPTAFIVARKGSKLTPDDVHKFLEGKVASYKKLRGGVYLVDSLPKSAAGKMLKTELRKKLTTSKL